MMARNKHRNVPCVVDGRNFDSGAEARRWQELKYLELAGEISPGTLQHHQLYALHAMTPSGLQSFIGNYEADFCYRTTKDEYVVEDVKGQKRNSDLFSWKKRHMRIEYGITIQEIRYERTRTARRRR